MNPQALQELPDFHRGYEVYWSLADKPGYSGVATFTRIKPEGVFRQLGEPSKIVEGEGRVVGLQFGPLMLINAYFPNSQPDHARLDVKLDFCDKMLRVVNGAAYRGESVVLTGDVNIAHKENDLANPQANKNASGFLPEERAWLDTFLAGPCHDGFRQFEQSGGHYTWWSYRAGVRERNIGWRIDYVLGNVQFNAVLHHPDKMGSDHCPVSALW